MPHVRTRTMPLRARALVTAVLLSMLAALLPLAAPSALAAPGDPAVFSGSVDAGSSAWAAYDVDVAEDGLLTASLAVADDSADLDLWLRGPADADGPGPIIATSRTGAAPEQVSIDVAAGTYRVYAQAVSGASDFTITADVQTGDAPTFLGTADDARAVWTSWPVEVSAPGRFTASLKADDSAADLNLYVRGPGGESGPLIAVSATGATTEQVTLDLTEAGTYQVYAEAASGASAFSLAVDPAADTILGSADAAGPAWFSYDVEVTDVGFITASLISDDPAADLDLYLRGPGGTSGPLVATSQTSTNPEQLSHPVDETGTWTVYVHAKSGASSYSLDVQQNSPTILGSADSSGSAWLAYDVNVTEPGLLTALVDAGDASADLDLYVRGPGGVDGPLVAVSTSGVDPEGTSVEVTETGVYRVYVHAASGASDFTLDVQQDAGAILGAVEADGQVWRDYAWTVDAPGTLSVSLDALDDTADLNLYVRAPDDELFVAATGDDPEVLELEVTEAGTYTLYAEAASGGSTFVLTPTLAGSTSQGSAQVDIDPSGDGIDGSTYNGGSFSISNTGDVAIDEVTLDLSTAVLPDMVFDPVGSAGDATGKCLEINSGATATGYVAPGDPCVDPFSKPHNGTDASDGWDAVTLAFDDFGPGETVTFAVDVDPTTIKNAGSTGNAGSVSGLELTGSTVTTVFADGELTAETWRKGTANDASQAVVQAGLPGAPTIGVAGVTLEPTTLSAAHTAATVTDPAQTIEVSGPADAAVTLLQLDSALVQMPGYEVEDFEANKVVAIAEYDATIGTDGTVDIPVTLTDTAGATAPDASGLNHFVAAIDGGDAFGANSNVVVLELGDDAGTADALYRINAGGGAYTDGDGNDWVADTGFTGGQQFSKTVEIDGTDDDPLYQTERYGDPFSYALDVDNGTYTVDLLMSELYVGSSTSPSTPGGEGKRLFDVTAEDELKIDDLDLWATYGAETAGIETFDVEVTDGTLDLVFEASANNAKVSGIVVTPATGGGDGPVLGADPASVDFGAVAVDGTATETVTLSNDGSTGDVEISSVALADGSDAAFSIPSPPTTPVTLAPGETLAVDVEFAPTAEGTVAGDLEVAHDATNASPVTVALSGTGQAQATAGEVLYRFNAGGPTVAANDGGPDWQSDGGFDGLGGSSKTSSHPVDQRDATVPDSVPQDVFGTERYGNVDGDPMTWTFDVASGTPVEVRLLMANGFSGTSEPGERIFDVEIEGAEVFSDIDLSDDPGHQIGTMKTHQVTSDGQITVTFLAQVENPTVNAVELVVAGPQTNVLGVSPSAVDFGSVVVDGGTATETVTMTNLGESGDPAITISDASVSGSGDFSVTAPGSTELAPGESTTVDVTYDPSSAGDAAATLTVAHSGDNAPSTVDLTGAGVSDVPVSFDASGLAGESSSNPTSLEFGPDGRLYVAQQNGTIYAYTVERSAANDYDVVDTEQIDTVKEIVNHNDDGTTAGAPTDKRQITGIMTAGTADAPVLYVTSSDPRIEVSNTSGPGDSLDTNSGVLSKLTLTDTGWDHVQLVRGLPRSEENHSTNGLDLDPATNTLYVMSGGHTNKGAPSDKFSYIPEYAYAAALLSVDLDAVEGLPTTTDGANGDAQVKLDLPTLAGTDLPFGGQDGANMAIITSDSPVQVHSPGWRNAYDVVFTEAGELYTVDNGPNTGWGGVPVGDGTDACTNEPNESGSTGKQDNLHHISEAGYYGGHPNPTRGNPDGAGLYDDAGTQVGSVAGAVPSANPVECTYLSPNGPNEDGNLHTWGASTNGLAEYTASNFGGALAGDLYIASFDGGVYRADLNAAGDDATVSQAFSNFGSKPLDVTTVGDDGPFPGTIWAATYGSNAITIFEPGDYDGAGGGGCDPSDPDGDADGDGFTNSDEADNGTDPCSGADVPADFDGDGVSNLNDADDDEDGIDDVADVFARDASNGADVTVPDSCPEFTGGAQPESSPGCYEMTNGAFPGSLLDIGFTGVMLPPALDTDYESLYDADEWIAGGAANVLTLQETEAGDAFATGNDQQDALQLGMTSPGEPFTLHTRVLGPFDDGSPTNYQSAGFYLGTGTQADYVKLVVAADGGDGGVQLLVEQGDTKTDDTMASEPGVVGNATVDLYLTVDPATGEVTGSYSLDQGDTVTTVDTVTVPTGWVDGVFATGVIATHTNTTQPIDASWAFLRAETVADGSGGGGGGGTSAGSAAIAVTPGAGDIDASTYGGGSFEVANTSGSGGPTIEQVTFDLTTAMLPDLVFDPDGTAGDTTAKGFSADGGTTATGQSAHAFGAPNNGTDGADGYGSLTVDFTEFDPGETFTFSIDNDPTSIKGASAPGPNEAGSVSGLELAGSTVTVEFSDGTVTTGLFGDGSDGGAVATVAAGLPDAPTIAMAGVDAPATVSDADQQVVVSGPAGATATLLQVEAGLFIPTDGAYAGTGYDIDPFEANSAVDVVDQQTATIGSDGTATFDVTLTRADDDSGLHHFLAVVDAGDGDGAPSAPLVVEYDPGSATGSSVVYRVNVGGPSIAAGDDGPDWAVDTKASPSPFLVGGGADTFSTGDTVALDASVPSGTPAALFQTERYDKPAAPEMTWSFDVTSGVAYEVRLYFAEIFLTDSGNNSNANKGPRVLDVQIEDDLVVDGLDQYATWGHDVGGMVSHQVQIADDFLDITLLHDVENPNLKGIEIVAVDQ